MNASAFREGDWKDTGIVLVISILNKKGTAGDLCMVNLRSANTNDREDDEILWENLGTDSFTLARVTLNLNLSKRSPCKEILNPDPSKISVLKLGKRSVYKVEFVCTNWREGGLV
jgi:hypothetical protein